MQSLILDAIFVLGLYFLVYEDFDHIHLLELLNPSVSMGERCGLNLWVDSRELVV